MRCKSCNVRFSDYGAKQPSRAPEELCSECLSLALSQYVGITNKQYLFPELETDLFQTVWENREDWHVDKSVYKMLISS